MPIYGVDIHPRYQAGISIEQIRREGFDFMAVKVSEATDGSFMGAGSADFLRRGKAVGLLCLGYHYLRAGNEDAQARLFAQQLRTAGVPGMLDAEDGAGNINNIRLFIDRCRFHGAHVPLMYLPRWYWQRIGSPDLRGLPPLWASRYVSGDPGPASTMYQRHNPAGWDPYGGLNVAILQFTSSARIAGRNIDANAFRGTREEFAALIGGSVPNVPTVPTVPEDDMPDPSDLWNHLIDDPAQSGAPKPAGVMLGWATTHASWARERALDALHAVTALAAQMSSSSVVTQQVAVESIRPVLQELIGSVVREAVLETLGEDKDDDADAIVDAITRRLAA